jgi:hypothetical protein
LAFSTFDLSTRQSRELTKVENAGDWDIFHDGSGIAALIKGQGKNRIRIVRFSGDTEREFNVEQQGIRTIYCASDGKRPRRRPALPPLLHGSAGSCSRALAGESRISVGPIQPSPDGRYLAMSYNRTTAHDVTG